MHTLKKIAYMYIDGFRNMTIGRKLWAIILIKLAVIFVVLKLFFFPDLLHENYGTDDERADAVRSVLSSENQNQTINPLIP